MNECSQTVDLKVDTEPTSSEKRECVQKKWKSKPKMMLQNQKYCCPCHKNRLACTVDGDSDNPHGSTVPYLHNITNW